MKIYLTIAGLLAISCFSATAQAQLSWVIDSIADTVGNTVVLPVKVIGFSNLVSMQGTINFDPSIIAYGSVSLFGLSGLTASNFGTTNISTGKLTYSWFDGGLGGQSVADSSTIFAISFDLIGNMGSSTSIAFNDDPVLLECVDTGFNTITTTYTSGAVSILDTSATVSLSGFPQYNSANIEAYPNPFGDDLTVLFQAKQTGEARVRIVNSIGKEMYDEYHHVNRGNNTIALNSDRQFLESSTGVYFVKLQMNEWEASYKLIKNK